VIEVGFESAGCKQHGQQQLGTIRG
jgi:hypothetical protein